MENHECKVIVVRHGKKESLGFGTTSWSLQSCLTDEGKETARQVYRNLAGELKGCRIFFCSPLWRAQQTVFEVMKASGIPPEKFDLYIHYHPGLWSGNPAVWYDGCPPEEYCNARIYKAKPAEVEAEGSRVFTAVKDAVRFAQQSADDIATPTVFAVSHSGPLDSAIMLARRALGQPCAISDLAEGQGAIFVFRGNTLVRVENVLCNA
ncbi:MAG: histidine phosphatase family protein [Candidatus Staskawiczbacteria bacterium]|jgi:broad specificity phosphatase PhoE